MADINPALAAKDAVAKSAAAATATANTTVDTASFAAGKTRETAEHFTAAGGKAFKDGVEKSLSSLNDMNAHSKQNLEALVAAATAAAKGAESLGAQALAYSKSAMESHVEAAKAVSTARSVQEVIELQTAYARTAMETYVAEMNKASEIFSAAVKGAFRPLNERATAVAETMQSAR
jgi:phasin family protein